MKNRLLFGLIVTIALEMSMAEAKMDSQTKVETEEYTMIDCINIDICRECSYEELKQIKECK